MAQDRLWIVDYDSNMLPHLSALGVAAAGLSFATTETLELGIMIYEAWQEIRNARRDKLIQQGVEQERERLRQAGVQIPVVVADQKAVGDNKKTFVSFHKNACIMFGCRSRIETLPQNSQV